MADKGYKTACVVVDVADGPQEWANALEKSFEEGGGKVLLREDIATVQADWYSIMTKFKSRNPDVIIPWAYEEGQCKAILAAKEIGYTGPLSISYNVSPRTPEMLGVQKAEGLMWVGEMSDYRLMNLADDKIGRVATFAKRFKDKYGRLPHTLSCGLHDSIWAIAKACEAKNTITDVNAIRAALGKVFQEGNFQLRYGYKDVLGNGLMYVENIALFEMRNGKPILIKEVTPPREMLERLPEGLKKK
jgi:ABC-type branched-subunit amino acid transport system substrate-binding protein